MTQRDVLAVSMKILGIVCGIWAVTMLVQFPVECIAYVVARTKESPSPLLYLPSALVYPVLYAIVAFVLLVNADSLARRLVPEEEATPPLPAPDWEKPLFVLALRVAGIICAILGLPALGMSLTRMVIDWRHSLEPLGGALPAIIGAVLRLAIGVYLLWGGKHVVAWVFRDGAVSGQEK